MTQCLTHCVGTSGNVGHQFTWEKSCPLALSKELQCNVKLSSALIRIKGCIKVWGKKGFKIYWRWPTAYSNLRFKTDFLASQSYVQNTHDLPGLLVSKKAMSCFSTALKTSPCTEVCMRLMVMLYMRSHKNSSTALKHATEDTWQRKVPKITRILLCHHLILLLNWTVSFVYRYSKGIIIKKSNHIIINFSKRLSF